MPFVPSDEIKVSGITPQIADDRLIEHMNELDFTEQVLPAAYEIDHPLSSGQALVDNAGPTSLFGEEVITSEQFDGLIRGYEGYASAFSHDETMQDFINTKRRIDRERANRQILQDAGWAGIGASAIVGLTDPFNALPGGAVFRGATKAARVLESAKSAAKAGLISSSLSEATLHATQETRTYTESALNIAAAAIVSSILGAGGAHAREILSQRSRAELEKAIKKDLDGEWHYADRAPIKVDEDAIEGTVIEGSIGAASVRTSKAEEEAVKGAFGLEKAAAFMEPVLRTSVKSTNVATRQTVQDLAETPMTYAKNAFFIESPYAVETLIKGWEGNLYKAIVGVDDQLALYRLGRVHRLGDSAMMGVKDTLFRNKEILTRSEFYRQVGKAMRRGDKHDIPEVQEAARVMRRELFDPLKERAIQAGIFPEDIDVKTADSYLTRIYEIEKIIKKRPMFEEKIVTWLDENRAIQEGKLDNMIEEQTSLGPKIEKAEDSLHKVAPQFRENRKAYLKARDKYKESARDLMAAKRQSGLTETELKNLEKRADLAKSKVEDEIFEVFEPDSPGIKKVTELRIRLTNNEEALAKAKGELSAAKKRESSIKAKDKAEKKRNAKSRKFNSEVKKAQEARLKAELNVHNATSDARAIKSQIAAQVEGRLKEIDLATKKTKAKIGREKERLDKAQEKFDAAKKQKDELYRKLANDRQNIKVLESSISRMSRRLKKLEAKIEDDRIFATLSRDDLELIASDITDQIIGNNSGRMMYEPFQLTRGPMKDRTLGIHDLEIEDFLEDDIETIARIFTRTMAPDVELTAKFGDTEMSDQLSKIKNNAALMRKGVTDPKKLKKLDNDLKRDLRDIEAIRDRLRGTFALPTTAWGMAFYRGARFLKNHNYVRMLGGMTVGALADAGRSVMKHGIIRTVGDGFIPLIRSFKTFRLSAEDTKMAGTGLDWILDTRSMKIADVFDDFGRRSTIERGMDRISQNFGRVSLMAPWNAFWKQFNGMISQTRTIKAAQAVVKGTASKSDIERLAHLGINERVARKIAEQFEKYGDDVKGVYWANTQDWKDLEAMQYYRGALVKDVDSTIVTPGQDKSIWLSTPLGGLIGQFKSFGVSSMQRVTIAGLQQRDRAVLEGVIFMVALGALSVYFRSKISGKETGDSLEWWVKAGIDRSGLTGWLMDAHNVVERGTEGRVGLSRFIDGPTAPKYQGRTAWEAVGGPTVGTFKDLGQVIGAAASEDPFRKSDTNAARRLIPVNNVDYLRGLFDEAEEGINEAMGVRK